MFQKLLKISRIHWDLFIAFGVALLLYLIFFYKLFLPNMFFWGSDAQNEFYPARVYFYESVVNNKHFPFWTERMFSGFPIYADLENAYLNIPNILSILIFGPMLSYKILHLGEFLLGSLSLFYFLKRKGIGLVGFIATETAFYFSTFFLNHQVHFNIVMALYLFPAVLLLIDYYIEKSRLKYLILTSLLISNAFYWGHLQTVLLIIFGAVSYFFVFAINKIKLKTLLGFVPMLGLLTLLECLPQLLPTYSLALNSVRAGDSISSKIGAITPSQILVIAYPTLFGNKEQTNTSAFNVEYSYMETYVYFGISVIVLGFFALFLTSNSRLKIYAYLLISIFLILGFSDYAGPLNIKSVPFISMFRFWNRSAVLASFGVALLAGSFLDSLLKKTLSFKWLNTLPAVFPTIFWFYMYITNKTRPPEVKTFMVISSYLHHDTNYVVWLYIVIITFVVSGVALVLYFLLKKHTQLIYVVIVLLLILIVFDLRYMGRDILALRISEVSNIAPDKIPPTLVNKRIITNSGTMYAMRSLYYSNWWAYGYSQLADAKYEDKMQQFGIFGNLKGPSGELSFADSNLQIFKQYGIVAALNKDQITFLYTSPASLDVIDGVYHGKYLEKREGYIKFKINVPVSSNVKTFIRNYPEWKVYVNGVLVENLPTRSLFLTFHLPRGESTVVMAYTPIRFYQGLAITLSSTLLFCVYMYLKRFYGSHSNLKKS